MFVGTPAAHHPVEIVGVEVADDAEQIEVQGEVISSSSVGASTGSARTRVRR